MWKVLDKLARMSPFVRSKWGSNTVTDDRLGGRLEYGTRLPRYLNADLSPRLSRIRSGKQKPPDSQCQIHLAKVGKAKATGPFVGSDPIPRNQAMVTANLLPPLPHKSTTDFVEFLIILGGRLRDIIA